MIKPILVDTETAALFIVRCRHKPVDEESMRSARKHIYNCADRGYLTRYGESKRGRQLWDLRELGRQYRKTIKPI